MKKTLLSLLILLATTTQLFASHGMGGEITWLCQGNGQFVFTLKFYRDCNGISGPASLSLSTNHPVGNIPMNKIATNDISPDGVLYNGTGVCATCPQGGNPPTPGLVEEHIFQSNPVTLAGIPPAAGWVFSWGTCCRSGSINNIVNPGSQGFLLRAVMYPYNATNTSPCFDSSPTFAERPSTIICTGYPFTYNHNAIDPEQDSLVYTWGQPLDNAGLWGAPLAFTPGYTLNSQLPGPTQHPQNTGVSLDPFSGEINYTSFTGGYFATVLKVTAYKCGIKVAEVFREINVVLNSNCPVTMAGTKNLPPDVNAPFFDPVTGLQTAYHDTVYAGDTVNFFLNATDFDFFQNGGFQSITIDASGNQFGTNFTNPNAGCLIAPCATLSQTVPFSFPIAGGIGFNWVTTCDHVAGINSACFNVSNTYTFVIKATDNYCPANASNYSTISVTVLPPPTLDPPTIRCASVNTNGSVSLSWTESTEIDTQETFHSYDLYASLSAAGPWTLVDSVKTGFNTTTYTNTVASLNTLLGVNAQQQSIFYHIKTRSGCTNDSISLPSNVVRTIDPSSVLNASIEAVISWNAFSNPPLTSSNPNYLIYKSYPLGSPWVLLDSTALLTYTDTTTKQICDDYVAYRIDLPDSIGCVSKSSFDTLHVVNNTPTVAINPVNPSFCIGGNVSLTASPSISYLWNAGQTTQSINVTTTGTYTVTVTQTGGCTATNSTTVTVNALPTPTITGNNTICAGQTTTFNAGPYSSYLWSNGATTQNISPLVAGPYTVTVTDANGCTNTDTETLTIFNNPAPVIVGNFTICAGQNTNLNAGSFTSYQWSTGATTQVINVSNAGPFTVTVTAPSGCTGTTTQGVTVNALPTPTITGTTTICQGQITTLDAGPGYSSYQWSNGSVAQTINISNTNTFTVTVTDANGCVNTDTETVTVNPNPTPSITGTNIVCQGTSANLNAGAGYSGYLWSTGATTQILTSGTAGPVTVTVTDANNCTGTAVSNITVNTIPTATISGIDSICDGQASQFNITFGGAPGPYTYSYSDGSTTIGPLNTGAGQVNIPVSPNSSTNYSLVSVSNNNCPGTISGTSQVHVTPLPTATLSGTNDICIGSSTNLTINFTGVAPYTYSYTENGNLVGPFTSNAANVSIPVTPLSTSVYGLPPSVIGFGCAGTTSGSATVTVNPLPTAVVSGNNSICAGNTTDLTFNFTGTGPYNYSYSDGTTTFGPFTTSNNPETVTVSPGTTTNFSLINISDANCTGTVSGTVAIIVNPIPTASISGTTNICDGTSTDLQILFTGTGPFTYEYTDGTNTFGPFNTNLNPVQIPVSPSTTTTYNLVNLSDINCPGTVAGVAEITVIPLPTSTLSGTTAICNGSSTNLSLTFTGQPPFEYFYTDGTNNFGPILTNNFNVNIPVTPSITTTYSVTTVTGAGCLGTPAGVVDIIVNELPVATATLSGNGVICEGESSQFTLDFTGVAPFTYEYTDGSTVYGPFTTNNNSEVLPVSPITTTTYSLVSLLDLNCPGSVSGSAQVVVNQLPTASVTGNQSICDGSSTTFSINFTGTGPYTYTYSDGGTVMGPFTTSNNPEIISITPGVTTTYAPLTVSDANCTGSASGTIDVVVNEIPTAVISGVSTICYGEQTDFNLTFTGNGPFTYTYTDGSSNFGPFTTSDINNIIPVSPGATSTYTLVSISDINCPGIISGNAEITVNLLPEPLITGDLSICDGEVTELSATPGFVTYDWSNGSPQTSIVTGVGGIYTVTVTDLNGCEGTSPAANLVVNMVPVVSFTNDTTLSCLVTSVNFINTSAYDPGSEFKWEFGDGFTSSQSNPSHVYADPGLYLVTLTITTPAGCINTITQPVDVVFFPLADAEFTSDPNFTNVFNARVQFTDLSTYAVSWYWEFGDGSTSTEQNPIHYFNDVGDFNVRLTVTNISGCPDTREHEVVINPFYIPNAFTPNTDGINDYFFDAGYVLDVADFRMLIFNRWGQEVYKAEAINAFWNGQDLNGDEAPQGVYVYKIDVKTKGGKKHTFNGTVTLIR